MPWSTNRHNYRWCVAVVRNLSNNISGRKLIAGLCFLINNQNQRRDCEGDLVNWWWWWYAVLQRYMLRTSISISIHDDRRITCRYRLPAAQSGGRWPVRSKIWYSEPTVWSAFIIIVCRLTTGSWLLTVTQFLIQGNLIICFFSYLLPMECIINVTSCHLPTILLPAAAMLLAFASHPYLIYFSSMCWNLFRFLINLLDAIGFVGCDLVSLAWNDTVPPTKKTQERTYFFYSTGLPICYIHRIDCLQLEPMSRIYQRIAAKEE